MVQYLEIAFWRGHRGLIVALILGIVIQTLWIFTLFWQRARTKKAISILFESEERFKRMADMAPVLIWTSDQTGIITYMNAKRLEFTTGTSQEGLGAEWTHLIHPDDLADLQTANAQALGRREGFSREYRLRRRDGLYRWMLDVASPRTNGDGSFAGFIGSAIDITDQKLAQDALEAVGGRLIEAQEKERSRIARELHDDICQRLALLAIELDQAIEGSETNGQDSRWPGIRQHCVEITSDVQALSHELHSSKLEHLGLVSAVRSFCSEFSTQHAVDVAFAAVDVPKGLPSDVSLCLFRIAQEALHNGLKHSGVREFRVHLAGTPAQVNLDVRDAGIGFDADQAMTGRGLGLVSMQERIHAVHGTISIDSKLNGGTTIQAKIPLHTKIAALSASKGAGWS